MSNQVVNRGTAPNDQQADTLYDAFGKVNDKFDEQDDLKQVQDASEKETPVDADSLPLIDSAAAVDTPKLKWLSWVNVKATLKTYFDTLYNNLGLGETDTTAYRGDRGKIGYDHSQTAHAPSNATAAGEIGDAHAITAHAPSNATANDTDANLKARSNHTGTQLASTISNFAATVRATVLTGLSLTTNAAIAATDSVLSALGKLQKQITDHFTSHPAPTNRDTRNEAANANIQTHVTSAHAPSNATAAGATGDAHAVTDHAPSNATANDTDANLKARSNHTGTQLAATISNFADTVRATVLTGLSLTTNAAIAATDTVLSALGKLQKQITDHFNSHPAPTNRDTRNEAANANIQSHVTSAHAPSNATANDTDANLKARGNHTGTQLAATISNFADTVRATVLTGLSLTTNAAISATDTVLSALGKLQKQITDHFTSHPAPTNRDTRNEAAFTKYTAFNKNFGSASGTVTQGNDGRLSDTRNPNINTVSGDWNDVLTTGFFMGDGLLNESPGSSWRYCIVMRHNDSWISQTMMDFGGNGMYRRVQENGTWYSWKRIDNVYGTSAATACEGNDGRLPTTTQKSALAGMGTPSATVKYVNGTYGIDAPSGGTDGDVYFQYE